MRPRSYVLMVLGTLLCGACACGIFVWLVNPYFVLHEREWPGFNFHKTNINRRSELYKAYLLDTLRPDTIILGNSRSEVGFDANYSGFSGKVVVNAAISGANMLEMARVYRHAVMRQPTSLVIIGLDVPAFIVTKERATMEDSGIGEALPGWQRQWKLLKIHLSSEALVDAYQTVQQQGHPVRTPFSAADHGNRSDRSVSAGVAIAGGSGLASQQFINEVVPHASSNAVHAKMEVGLKALEEIILDACSKGIKLKLVLPPIHARLLEVWDQRYGEDLLPWTVEKLVRLVDDRALQCKGTRPELWTALAYTELTTEPLPPRSAGKAMMKNYWEISHFRRTMGATVLDGVLDIARHGNVAVTQLNKHNLETYLASLKQGRMHFLHNWVE